MTSAYSINLNPNITTPVKTGYTFKSGDKGITFNIAVTEMDPTGTSAKIAFHRANGTSVEAALSGQGPTYSYTILGNEFAVPGIVVADVKFYQSTTQRVSTASFVFNVINDTLDGLGGGTAGYSDELETLSAAMEGYIEAFGNLGPINPRGAYNASTAYEPADCVSYNSNSWLCIQPCTGVTPSEGAYWQQVADMATGKADKVNGATNGNFAGLNASGNLTDSGMSPTEINNKFAAIEPTVGKSIKATNRAWTGNSLTFADIPAHNGTMYRFSAMRNDGMFTEYMIINRTDGLKSFKVAGDVDCTFTMSASSLTITLSQTGFWNYQLAKLNNYN